MQTDSKRIAERFYPEIRVGGFTRDDASIEFYTRIWSLVRPTDRVLDYGAGRGAQIENDSSPHRRAMKIFKGKVATSKAAIPIRWCSKTPISITRKCSLRIGRFPIRMKAST